MATMQRTAQTRSDGARPDSLRRTASVVGWAFVVTYVTSIAAKFALYPPMYDGSYITNGDANSQLLWGAFSELLLIIANIVSAVALFSLLRRRYENLALGFVTARVMESVFIAVGILCVLTLVTMQQDHAGATGLATVGDALVAMQQWTFNLGPAFVVGIGNGMILGYLMYRTGLVPRKLATLGLVGGPLICISGAAVVLGFIEAGSAWQSVATIPEGIWELAFGIYLIVKGFKPAPITADLVA